jgi:hypothetical protein
MTNTIAFVNGQEEHSSNWGKYYVKGLENWQVREDFDENIWSKHETYQGYVCLDIPDDTIFTIFEQDGNKHGVNYYSYAICKTTSLSHNLDTASYGSGFCKGNWEVIVEGIGKIKAPRLMDWWIPSEDKSLQFAYHCDCYISKRGIKVLPPMV